MFYEKFNLGLRNVYKKVSFTPIELKAIVQVFRKKGLKTFN